MAQGFAEQMGNITPWWWPCSARVFFTILLVAGNTMAQSVRERTEEIGVLKALGFSDGLVLAPCCGVRPDRRTGRRHRAGRGLVVTMRGSRSRRCCRSSTYPSRPVFGVGLILALGW
jgi:hypothetical protein